MPVLIFREYIVVLGGGGLLYLNITSKCFPLSLALISKIDLSEQNVDMKFFCCKNGVD